VRTEEVVHRVLEEKNIVHTVKRRNANFIGYILRRNCLLKHINKENIERSVEVTLRQGRRRKQLLGDLKETKGYCKLKEDTLVTLCAKLALEEAVDLS
jgi:hypothetical protein